MTIEPIIRWENIHKSFGEKPVLRGVDLYVSRGESLVVIGRSGSGKTVLMKTLVGLVTPDDPPRGSSRITVDGRPILGDGEDAKRGMEHARTVCGMVFQNAALFDSMTVAENLALPWYENTDLPISDIRERVSALLARVGMSGAEELKPAELSGGMRKRVGLARALADEPEIILYDEPTTGLDPVTADSINELILQMQRELSVTSIVVTHDMASARKVGDRVVMLHEGRIIFNGPPEALDDEPMPAVRAFIQGRAGMSAELQL